MGWNNNTYPLIIILLALKDRPPPIIRQGPSNQTQALGAVTLLRCQASGDPEPTVTWRKNGASLLGKDPRFSLLDHGSLQIQNTRVGSIGLHGAVIHVAQVYNVAQYERLIYDLVWVNIWSFIPADNLLIPWIHWNLHCILPAFVLCLIAYCFILATIRVLSFRWLLWFVALL